jgi:hypothetical protein
VGVVSAIELARTVEEGIGEAPRAIRRFAVVLTDDTLQNNPPTETQITTACVAGGYGTAHPTMSAYSLRKFTINERFSDSPYHVEVVAEYDIVDPQEILIPYNRAAVWTFEGQPSEIAALSYFNGSGNADPRPLVNSANDYLQGLVTAESMITATVKKNYQNFPNAQVIAINSINDSDYLGAGSLNKWKVSGGNVSQATEVVAATKYTFWAAEWKLQFRQTGWVLQIPDVGWNFLLPGSGEKRRCMVFDDKNAEWIASPTPMPLSSGQQQLSGRPDILPRRVNPVADFSSLFGTPPS